MTERSRQETLQDVLHHLEMAGLLAAVLSDAEDRAALTGRLRRAQERLADLGDLDEPACAGCVSCRVYDAVVGERDATHARLAEAERTLVIARRNHDETANMLRRDLTRVATERDAARRALRDLQDEQVQRIPAEVVDAGGGAQAKLNDLRRVLKDVLDG